MLRFDQVLPRRAMLHARTTPILCALLCSAFPCRAWGLTPEPASFSTADGVRLAADYYPPPLANRQDAPFVLLVHDLDRQRTDWEPLLVPLHDAGFAILALDLRGHGESATTESRQRVTDRDRRLFADMQEDLRGAYAWIVQQPRIDRARFAIISTGFGAALSIRYAAKDRSLDALVALSPPLDQLGHDAAGDMHQITGRAVLLVAADADKDAAYTLQKQTAGVEIELVKDPAPPAGGTADIGAAGRAEAPSAPQDEADSPAGADAGDARERKPRPADSEPPGRDPSARGATLLNSQPELPRRIARFVREAVGPVSNDVVCGSINSPVFHKPGTDWAEKIAPGNLRFYSSPKEAEARGLRAAKTNRKAGGGRRP